MPDATRGSGSLTTMTPSCIAATTGALGAVVGFFIADQVHRRRRPDGEIREPAPASVFDRGCSLGSAAETENGDLAMGVPGLERGITDRRKIYGLGGFCTHNRVLLCMVGLPARGKSYIVKMIMRYLCWTGFPVKCFNAGELRRQEGMAGVDANFFRTDDEAALSRREQIASRTMEEALQWLAAQNDVSVAIFDATNTTIKRRKSIAEGCRKHPGITPLFVESICNDPEVLEANYALKLGNDDYKNMDPVQARKDFLQRVGMYEGRYQPITDDEDGGKIRYIKVFNVGQKVVLNHCDGYAPSHIGFYLSNIHIKPRKIWLAQHAQTRDDQKGILGSIAGKLTKAGKEYCRGVAALVHRATKEIEAEEGQNVIVLMGTAPVHQATAEALCKESADNPCGLTDVDSKAAAVAAKKYPVISTSLLNELDGGDCNGMSYAQIQRDFPAVWSAREKDKLNFRYPGAGGESYIDVINRLRPVIIELERYRSSVLVISHLAVQRCIWGYFTGSTMEELPYINMPMHTLFELQPGPFGTGTKIMALDTP